MFTTAICHKGGKFLEIWGFFSIFFAGINFRGFNKIEYFAGTNFRDFGQKPRKARKLLPATISTTKVYAKRENLSDVQVSYSDIGKIKYENTELIKCSIWYFLSMLLIITFTLNFF